MRRIRETAAQPSAATHAAAVALQRTQAVGIKIIRVLFLVAADEAFALGRTIPSHLALRVRPYVH